jgi:hypothetical protein
VPGLVETPVHLGPLHPVEQVLIFVLAFGPLLLLALTIWVSRRRNSWSSSERSERTDETRSERSDETVSLSWQLGGDGLWSGDRGV